MTLAATFAAAFARLAHLPDPKAISEYIGLKRKMPDGVAAPHPN